MIGRACILIETGHHMANHKELKELIERYHQGKCSPKEIEQLRSFLQDPGKESVVQELYDLLPEQPAEETLIDGKWRIYTQLMNDVRINPHHTQVQQTIGRKLIARSWYMATACVLVLALSFVYYSWHTDRLFSSDWTTEEPKQVILPGGDRAHIILEDGTVIDLESIQGDTVITLAGFSILKTAEGEVSYQYDEASLVAEKPIHNTIVTPRGGQYRMTLPDGTQVWLNAESSLKYPVTFERGIRQVELSGEAYFDVANISFEGNGVPFIVQTGNQRLEVLGTEFNINSYGKDITTTLVEGKVRLGTLTGGHSLLLRPNEQSLLKQGLQSFEVKEIDPLYATAWKNGNFSFRRASINEVMESIARWYDVDVIYKGSFSDDFFTGTISRYGQIQELLQAIELTGSVRFNIEGRRVIVEK